MNVHIHTFILVTCNSNIVHIHVHTYIHTYYMTYLIKINYYFHQNQNKFYEGTYIHTCTGIHVAHEYLYVHVYTTCTCVEGTVLRTTTTYIHVLQVVE